MKSSKCSGVQFPISPQPYLGTLPPSRTIQTVQPQPLVAIDRPRECARDLLEALWRSPDCVHQIWFLDRRTDKVGNIPVGTVNEALERARVLSDAGIDVYFACAEYRLLISRKADNASGAYGFWVDLDCGEEKHAKGKGYRSIDDALVALERFCKKAGLPEPTHIVESGGGLHLYWVLDQAIEGMRWQAVASKLKSLTKSLGFLADDSRTADIASVLRLPGTLNYKTNPPKPVSLRSATKKFIQHSALVNAIDHAYDRYCGSVLAKVPSRLEYKAGASRVMCNAGESACGSQDIQSLASALSALNPDCDDEEWKLSRIAPLATLAREHPAYSKQLRELARRWSRGDLWLKESTKWVTPGSNGRSGEEVFAATWNRFLTSNYRGRPKTIATIYADAQEQGWCFGFSGDDQFHVVEAEIDGSER